MAQVVAGGAFCRDPQSPTGQTSSFQLICSRNFRWRTVGSEALTVLSVEGALNSRLGLSGETARPVTGLHSDDLKSKNNRAPDW